MKNFIGDLWASILLASFPAFCGIMGEYLITKELGNFLVINYLTTIFLFYFILRNQNHK